ncbi:unnamed protein product [Cylindrotheca closterium]|uniref:Disease resistance R13L4/SHOC-2-like LRR domain-containing protein n=1 Tax=Cylindrotheca closterium TaxID=2856 RepID=A0AAD2CMW3_9STRA|nr:unnamed protein product [Cylindrotheca closterium]
MRMRERRNLPIAVNDMDEEVDCKSAMRKNIEISIDIFVVVVVISAVISASVGGGDAAGTTNNNNSNYRGGNWSGNFSDGGDITNGNNNTLAPSPLPMEGNFTTLLPKPTDRPTTSPSDFLLYDAPLDEECQALEEEDSSSSSSSSSSWWQSHRNNALQRSIELVLDVKLLSADATITTTPEEEQQRQQEQQVVWIQDITTAMNRYLVPLLLGCSSSSSNTNSNNEFAAQIANMGDRSAYAISNATVVHSSPTPTNTNLKDENANEDEDILVQRVILTIHCLLKGYEDNDWMTTRINKMLNLEEGLTPLLTRLSLTDLLETMSIVQIVPTRATSLKSILGSDLQSLTSDQKFMLHPQAFYWLAELDTWKNTALTMETAYTWMSRYVLAIVFYENVFVGDVVNQTDNGTSRFQTWLSSSESACEWSGLDCDGDGILTRVYLDYDELTGHMPSEIGLLTHLTYLNLFQNALTGRIPTEIGKLTSLKAVFFAGNRLTGQIPSEIGELSSLTRLSLPNNNFSGPIPSEIGQLTELIAVRLSDNKLSGTIPSEIGMLTSATRLRINGNSLTGSIPTEIQQLTSLTVLFLNHNNLSGAIPLGMGMLTNLVELSCDQNTLTGSIPPLIGSLTGLTTLTLYDNELSGNIPSEMNQLSNLLVDRCRISEGNLFNDTSSLPGVCT